MAWNRLGALLLFALAQVNHCWGVCEEVCVYSGPRVANPLGCSIYGGGAISYEGRRWTLPKGKSCDIGGQLESQEMALCCSSKKDFEDFTINEEAKQLLGALAGAEEGEYVHQVKLDMSGSCGGTIYNKEWIITAAHCVVNQGKVTATPENAKVVAGRANVKGVQDSEKYPVDRIIVHDDWDKTDIRSAFKGHDIALFHLSKPLPLEIGKIQPLRLVDANYEYPYGGKGITIGWGKAGKLGSVEHLKEFEVPIHHPVNAAQLSFERLNANSNPRGFVVNNQLFSVAGGDSNYTVGEGDSGGPFICPDNQGRAALCGIASFKMCTENAICKHPSYYIKVTRFLDWIAEKTGNAQQEEEYLVNEPMLPSTLKPKQVPGYLVRINGEKKSCTGTLIAPNKVLTTGNCIEPNKIDGDIRFHVYHFKSERRYDFNGMGPLYNNPADLDLYPNITKYLIRPLGKRDGILIQLEENVEGYEPLKIPPKNYQIKGVAEEYEYNAKASAVQMRRYKAMDEQACQERLRKIDKNMQLDESQTCMQRAYSAEADANCERDLGGPLVCEGKYFCGLKAFQACGPLLSSLPEIFHNTMHSHIHSNLKAWTK